MTPLTASDVDEIRNLVARYCITTDNADADAFMRTWVEPAEFGGYDSGAFGRIDSWQQMLDFERHHVGPGGMANGKRHLSLNVLIEPLGAGEAHVTHDLMVVEVAEVPRVVATGRYDRSVVVKAPQGWRFKRRTLTVDAGFFKAAPATPA
jgi:hypothetical protein